LSGGKIGFESGNGGRFVCLLLLPGRIHRRCFSIAVDGAALWSYSLSVWRLPARRVASGGALGQNHAMVRQVDAIFSKGAFRPLKPLTMPEGTCVHLSVEEGADLSPAPRVAKMHTPKLAHPKDAADFVLEVRGTDHACV